MNLWQILQLLNESEESSKYQLVLTNRYYKDLLRVQKGSHNWQKDSKKLNAVLDVLKTGAMPQQNRPHKLRDRPEGTLWDIHVGSAGSDWLLIVAVDKTNRKVHLLATGTHSQLDQLLHT